MRGGIGRFYRSGTHTAFERQATLLNHKKQFKSEFDVDVGNDARENTPTNKKLGKVFFHTLVCFDEHGLWGHDNPQQMSIGDNFVTPVIIDDPCLGERRIAEYIAVQCKSTVDKNEDEADLEQVVSDANLLRRVEATVAKQQDGHRDHLDLSVLMTKDFLM